MKVKVTPEDVKIISEIKQLDDSYKIWLDGFISHALLEQAIGKTA